MRHAHNHARNAHTRTRGECDLARATQLPNGKKERMWRGSARQAFNRSPNLLRYLISFKRVQLARHSAACDEPTALRHTGPDRRIDRLRGSAFDHVEESAGEVVRASAVLSGGIENDGLPGCGVAETIGDLDHDRLRIPPSGIRRTNFPHATDGVNVS